MGDEFIASLRPWPVDDIVVCGRLYRIEALPALDWLEVLLADQISLQAVIPGFLGAQAAEDITDFIIDGRLDLTDIEQLVWDVVSVAAGRPWWVVLRIIGHAKLPEYSDIVRAELVCRGIDAGKISLSAWLDAVYGILVPASTPPEQRQKINFMLAKPPPGIKAEIDRTAQKAAFEALMRTG